MGPPQIEAAEPGWERGRAAVLVAGKGHVNGNMAVTIPLEVKTTTRTQQSFIVCASQSGHSEMHWPEGTKGYSEYQILGLRPWSSQ